MSTIPTSDTELWKACRDRTRKVMWVLYESPSDFLGKWVARFFVCDVDADFRARGTAFHEVASSRSKVEEALPDFSKGRWSFVPEYDPQNPQIVGVYR